MSHKLEPRRLRQAFGHFATGVAIMTARRADGAHCGMTVNSFSSLSLDPPLVLWSIAKSSSNYEVFVQAEHFVVHVLKDDQEPLSKQFSARGIDRFDGVAFDINPHGVPRLQDFHARLECSTHCRYDGGDHSILIGRVHDLDEREGEPLVFYRGQLNRLRDLDRHPA